MNIKFDRFSFIIKKEKPNINSIISEFKNDIISFQNLENFDIEDISSTKNLKTNSALFLGKNNNFKNFKFLNQIFLITDSELVYKSNVKNKILVKDIDAFYIKYINKFYIHEDNINYSDEFNIVNGSYISKYSEIDKSSKIGINCIIGRGVKIGKRCIIKNNVVIKNSILNNDILIGDNSVIGSSGFGFNYYQRGTQNLLPQIGIVYIENNVRIGSSCTIDRGKIDYTFIGNSTMIDNLVHIAHNVEIGKNACIAAQTGISGSVVIGSNITVGGQSGFAGHLVIGNNVVVAAKSGVTKNIKDNSIIAGFPAIDINKWKKSIILNRK